MECVSRVPSCHKVGNVFQKDNCVCSCVCMYERETETYGEIHRGNVFCGVLLSSEDGSLCQVEFTSHLTGVGG